MTDEIWMREALALADRAAELGEVPIGCVIVGPDGVVLGTGHNLRETALDPTAHAEIVAIRAAAKEKGAWRLDDATLYVTLEPCPMCAGAMVNARIGRVVYGCRDAKAGACDSLFAIGRDERLNHRFDVVGGVLEPECVERLQRFFKNLRAGGKNGRRKPDPTSG